MFKAIIMWAYEEASIHLSLRHASSALRWTSQAWAQCSLAAVFSRSCLRVSTPSQPWAARQSSRELRKPQQQQHSWALLTSIKAFFTQHTSIELSVSDYPQVYTALLCIVTVLHLNIIHRQKSTHRMTWSLACSTWLSLDASLRSLCRSRLALRTNVSWESRVAWSSCLSSVRTCGAAEDPQLTKQ